MKTSFLNMLYERKYIHKNQIEILEQDENYIAYLLESNTSLSILKDLFINNFYIKYYDFDTYTENKEALKCIDYEIANRYNVFPIYIEKDILHIVMVDPLNIDIIDNLKIITKFNVEPYFSNPSEITKHINFYYLPSQLKKIFPSTNKKDNVSISEQDANSTSIIFIFDSIITSAITQNASDIHIEPFENFLAIRFRLDGRLSEIKKIDISSHNKIISRIKIISEMDIGENRIPQEGHFKKEINKEKIDFRVSIIPSIYGETCVIRIIYSNNQLFDIDKLGFFEDDLIKIKVLLSKSHKALLVTGPTGSGKTTTLYSFLNKINSNELKIITIEDPVENHLQGVTQINLNKQTGIDFENGLSYILRQDPDVIMIGEVRNKETAEIMTKAAITGHMVLSTLHTNDSISTITRLLNMKIDGYIIAASIGGIISQRLVRKLCPACKKSFTTNKNIEDVYGIKSKSEIYKNVGCEKCNFTGYKGRFLVYEILNIDEELSNIIESNSSQNDIKDYLLKSNFKTIKDIMIENILLGDTTIEEMISFI